MHGRWQSCFLGIALVAGGSALSYAQETSATPATPPANATRRSMEGLTELRVLSQQLNLTAEQKEKLRPIVTEEGDQLHDVRRDEHLRPEQKSAKLLAIRQAFAPKIADVLTPDQQEKFKKIQESWQAKTPAGVKDATTPASPPQ